MLSLAFLPLLLKLLLLLKQRASSRTFEHLFVRLRLACVCAFVCFALFVYSFLCRSAFSCYCFVQGTSVSYLNSN